MDSLTLPIYDLAGKETGTVTLEATVFGVPIKHDLMHQALVHFLANRRAAIANTKDRSAVRGGGKKPWRQKGTGNARAGSSRSPLWRGGGATFGPTNQRNFSKRLPQTMRQGALKSALSSKFADNELIIIASLKSLDGKTKSWVKAAQALPHADKRMLIVDTAKNESADRSIRNSAQHVLVSLDELTIYDVLRYPTLMLTQEALDGLTARLAKQTAATPIKVLPKQQLDEVRV